ncbi:MAG: TonB-dependent receptor [Pseudomonadota bacterium]
MSRNKDTGCATPHTRTELRDSPTTVAAWIRVVLAGSAVTLAAGIPALASAADAAGELQEVTVTGSRIASPNMTSTSPVQVVTAEDIKAGGRTDISDLLNNLPQVATNYQGQGLGNRSSGLSSAGGVANVDLRGLGPNRTLVLVNGRRLGVGSPNTSIASPAPDIDQIPSALVERIDVLTGGASAVYGSDAIAGVVNFITKKNFTGIQLDYDMSANWHNNDSEFARKTLADGGVTGPTGQVKDGKNTNITLTMGTDIADGRGNITAYFGYLKNHSVPSSARDFGACQMFANANLDGADCGGSGNSNYFTLVSGGDEYQVAGNQFVPWGTVETSNPPPIYNSQSLIYFGRDNTRYNAGFMANLEISDNVKPYAEFTFMNDRSYQEIAPSALFIASNPIGATGGVLVNCSNPLLSAQQRGLICSPADVLADAADPGSVSADLYVGRRNVEGGGRSSFFEHTNFRGVAGVKGDMFPGWSYDAYGQYYYTTFFTSNGGYLDWSKIVDALQVTGTAAAPLCVSGGTCVPYNIFAEGAVTQDQLANLYTPGTATGNTALRTIHGDVTGDLGQYGLQLPWTDNGVGVNIGYEYRSEHLQYAPDAAQLGGLLSGAGGAAVAIDNTISVQEEFIEVLVPLVSDKPGIHELLFDTGFRYSDYSTGVNTNTYKFELQYAPTTDFRFRGGYQRAIRAPSIVELFKPQNVGQIQIGSDPCAPTRDANNVQVAAAATAAQCAASGVTAAQYGNGGSTNTIPQGTAGQLTQSQGGNPLLNAEQADSYTLGVVLTPGFLPNMTASIDYYDIKLEDQINTLPANVILQQCTFGGDPFYCSQLSRNPATGGLTGASVAAGGYIIQTNVNVGAAEVEGIDLQTTYKLDLDGLGSLRFQLNGSYVLSSTTTPFPGAHTYDCAGLFGPTCQGVHPEWQHSLRTTWALPGNVDVAATWRYVGTAKLDHNDPDETLNNSVADFGGRPNIFNASIAAYNYFDISAAWKPNDWITVRGGINNIFDKTPPIVTSELVAGGAANTYELYDPLGMQLFAGISLKF